VIHHRYENLTPADVKTIEEEGQLDAWVMALPNGGCTPFVNAIDQAQSEKSSVSNGEGSVIVDLSADFRFQCGEDVEGTGVTRWTYGLPGKMV
jgi:N-acetyl-gamma-glutamyl-phosphate reductase / acetylglutamate kinase